MPTNPCEKYKHGFLNIVSLYKSWDMFYADFQKTGDRHFIRGARDAKNLLERCLADLQKKMEPTMEYAERLLGPDYLGPADVEKLLDYKLKPEEIPEIPFKVWELKKAKELGMFLTC